MPDLACLANLSTLVRLGRRMNNELPEPGSPRGYEPARFIEPIVLTLHGGGHSLEDIRPIRNDSGLKDLPGIDAVPCPDATGDWF